MQHKQLRQRMYMHTGLFLYRLYAPVTIKLTYQRGPEQISLQAVDESWQL